MRYAAAICLFLVVAHSVAFAQFKTTQFEVKPACTSRLNSTSHSFALLPDEVIAEKAKSNMVTGFIIGAVAGSAITFIIVSKKNQPYPVGGIILFGGLSGGVIGAITGVALSKP
ncbi:hypothetical protein HUU42_03320 [bacterium]|nr:hypothetical protein [bacterium]